MPIVISAILGLAAILLAGLGAIRGLQRGILALMATLLGVVLADLWAANLAIGLVNNFEFVRTEAIGLISTLFLLGSALLIGYGGGILLIPPPKRMSVAMRAAGATLGLLNAIVLLGYLLNYTTIGSPDFAATVADSPIGTILIAGLPAFVLAASAMATVFIIGVQISRMVRARQTLPPLPATLRSSVTSTASRTTPSSPVAPPLSPTATQQQQQILNKVEERLREKERSG